MLALATASPGQNSTLVIVIVAAVAVVVFWRTILKVGIAAVIIGFLFLFIAGLLDVMHGLHALIP
jgi:Na+-transporting NADH:ubiquinone oxidoreductase subunit NqrB